MYLSGCLKMQINNEIPIILSFQDYAAPDFMLQGFSVEAIRATGLLQNNLICTSPYGLQGNLPAIPEPSLFFGIFSDYMDNELEETLEFTPMKAFGFDLETMKAALTMVAKSNEMQGGDLVGDIYAATESTLQSVLDSQAVQSFTVNLQPCVVRYMPVTPQELEQMNVTNDLKAQFVDAYPAIASFLTNTDINLENQGWGKSEHDLDNECVIFRADCSFSINTPADPAPL